MIFVPNRIIQMVISENFFVKLTTCNGAFATIRQIFLCVQLKLKAVMVIPCFYHRQVTARIYHTMPNSIYVLEKNWCLLLLSTTWASQYCLPPSSPPTHTLLTPYSLCHMFAFNAHTQLHFTCRTSLKMHSNTL